MSGMPSDFDELSSLYSDIGGIDDVPKELLRLLPRDKFDDDRIEDIKAVGMPDIQPILLHLLTWLQDGNWPISRPMARFLLTIGDPLVGLVRFILRSDDAIWKYWVLLYIVEEWDREFRLKVLADIRRIAESPTPDEVLEDLLEIAEEIIANTEP